MGTRGIMGIRINEKEYMQYNQYDTYLDGLGANILNVLRDNDLTELTNAERKADAGVEADQFFTRPEIAERFASWIKNKGIISGRVIEPATGSKDLAKHFPGIEMYDLFPQSRDITAQDFLTSNMGHQPGTVVVMNPPYGKSSDLAIKFFNKATEIADYIAMIVPRTFRRPVIQTQLHSNWHLLDEYVLPRNSFYLPAEGGMRPYDVPAVAMIWERKDEERAAPDERKTSEHFEFVKKADAEFAIRRKGRRAGQVLSVADVPESPSFYYIKGDNAALRAFKSVNWKELGNDVMGSRSLSQPDIITAVEREL